MMEVGEVDPAFARECAHRGACLSPWHPSSPFSSTTRYTLASTAPFYQAPSMVSPRFASTHWVLPACPASSGCRRHRRFGLVDDAQSADAQNVRPLHSFLQACRARTRITIKDQNPNSKIADTDRSRNTPKEGSVEFIRGLGGGAHEVPLNPDRKDKLATGHYHCNRRSLKPTP